jgi:hypothetical protein
MHIFNNSFQFEVEKDYFGIDILQRRYLTLTEMDLVKCRGKDILICPADHAVYSTEINSCALNLFQSTNPQETCGRRVTSRLSRRRSRDSAQLCCTLCQRDRRCISSVNPIEPVKPFHCYYKEAVYFRTLLAAPLPQKDCR